MTNDPSDLASLLTRAATSNSNQPLLSGLGQPGGTASFGQGRILSWSQSTFNNSIAYRGGVLNDLPVLSGPDALTYQADDIVAIMSWSPNGGATVHWIMGRVIVPGPGKGEATIDWMLTELGRRISAAVFAERVHADIVDVQGSLTTENVWVDTLDFAGSPSPGPSVQAEITETGRALVFVSSLIQTIDSESAWMSFRIDDEVNVPIGSVSAFARCPPVATGGLGVASAGIGLIEGLTPGLHTFDAAYRCSNLSNPFGVAFSDRMIVVMGF